MNDPQFRYSEWYWPITALVCFTGLALRVSMDTFSVIPWNPFLSLLTLGVGAVMMGCGLIFGILHVGDL